MGLEGLAYEQSSQCLNFSKFWVRLLQLCQSFRVVKAEVREKHHGCYRSPEVSQPCRYRLTLACDCDKEYQDFGYAESRNCCLENRNLCFGEVFLVLVLPFGVKARESGQGFAL